MEFHTPRALRRPGLAALALLVAWVGALAALAPGGAGAASLQVSPTRFEFSLDKRFTNYFIVTNNASQPVRIRIYAQFVRFDEGSRIRTEEGHPHDLGRWLVLNPRRMSLQGQERRVVRFSVRPPATIEPGEYRTVVFFEELPGPPTRTKPRAPQNQQGIGLELNLLTRLGVSLYGMKGERRAAVELGEAQAGIEGQKLVLTGLLRNTGNIHVPLRLEGELVTDAQETVETVSTPFIIQRDGTRRFTLSWEKPPPGLYHIRFTGTAPDIQVIERTYPVDVPQPSGS